MQGQPDLFLQQQENLLKPDFRVPFKLVLSWNDITSADRFEQGNIKKKWRQRGSDRLIETAKEIGLAVEQFEELTEKPYRGKNPHLKDTKVKEIVRGERLALYLFTEPVFLFVRLWKANSISFDVHNLMIKPIVDGFVDARLMPDDNTTFLPKVIYSFEGVDRSLELTAEKKQARKELQKRKRKHKPTPPANKRIWFDFYRTATLQAQPQILTSLLLHA